MFPTPLYYYDTRVSTDSSTYISLCLPAVGELVFVQQLRGAAVAEFETEAAAARCIEKMNRALINKKPIIVRMVRGVDNILITLGT